MRSIQSAEVTSLKRGPKVNLEFESRVIHQLFITLLTERQDGKVVDVEIVANIAFNYEMFKRAANDVMKEPKFANDPDLKILTFSNRWVQRLKRRYELRRRKCTTKLKPKPSTEQVQLHMKQLQHKIVHHGLDASRI